MGSIPSLYDQLKTGKFSWNAFHDSKMNTYYSYRKKPFNLFDLQPTDQLLGSESGGVVGGTDNVGGSVTTAPNPLTFGVGGYNVYPKGIEPTFLDKYWLPIFFVGLLLIIKK